MMIINGQLFDVYELSSRMRLISSLSRGLVMIVCLVLSACATPMGQKDLLDFLQDGVTHRDEVVLNLGEPSATYESMRILAYRVGKDAAGYVLVGRRFDWYGTSYSLILVFDEQGVLREHRMVQVKTQ